MQLTVTLAAVLAGTSLTVAVAQPASAPGSATPGPSSTPAAPVAAPADPGAAVGDPGRVFVLKSAAGRVVIVHKLPNLSGPAATEALEQHRRLGPTLAGATTVFAVALPADRFTSELAAVAGGKELPIYRDEGGAFAKAHGAPEGEQGVVVLSADGNRMFGVSADGRGGIDVAALNKRISDATKDRDTAHANLENGLALQGYDAVEYINRNRATPGAAGMETVYRGVRYRFASAANRDTFNAAPDKYLPAYGGWCATAIAKSDKVEVDPKNFKVTNGRLFLFYNGFWGDALKDWNKDEAGLTPKADRNWKTITSKR